MPQLLYINDSSYTAQNPCQDAILTELSNNPKVHDPRTLIMVLAGGWASNPPTLAEYKQMQGTELQGKLRSPNFREPVVVDFEYVEPKKYFENYLTTPDVPITPGEARRGWTLSYQKIDDELPSGVTPEDRNHSVVEHRNMLGKY